MAHELLFEIGTEEIPASFIEPALQQMRELMAKKLAALGLSHGEVRTAGTPRRLAIGVTGLIAQQPDSREEVLGPARKAGFDAEGRPTKAAEGFVKSRGATVENLTVVSTPKGEYLMLVIDRKGERTEALLCTLLPEIIREISFPKSMRWASGRATFARPIQWIAAVYGGAVVSFSCDGLASGTTSRGHRFMAPEAFSVGDSWQGYLDACRKAHIIVDLEERRTKVREEVARVAAGIGGRVLPDEELVGTVTNLVESPHALLGTFEERFLAVPQDVLITSMREHQKYFAVVDTAGRLMPHFIAVNNTRVRDEKLACEGHQRVLRARLEDAFFFFREDKGKRLSERVQALEGILFQNRLGTMLEKTARVAALTGLLAETLAPSEAETACRAANLAKADLLTAMVNEFPTLQGVMGREYALLDKEPAAVATAIFEHYQPVRAGGELPASMAGALVSMADRLDSVAGCFGIGQLPTGTTDPFGLRRLTLGLLAVIENRNLDLDLPHFIDKALELYGDKLSEDRASARKNILDFIKIRFANELASRGIPMEAIDAVVAVRFENPTDARQRIEALVSASSEETFRLLAGSFKRVNNIIKDHRETAVHTTLLAEAAELELFDAFQQCNDRVAPLVTARRYPEALREILAMKAPIDSFFDKVMVMAEDQAVRTNRLSLLAAIAGLFLSVGDFSRMYALGSQQAS